MLFFKDLMGKAKELMLSPKEVMTIYNAVFKDFITSFDLSERITSPLLKKISDLKIMLSIPQQKTWEKKLKKIIHTYEDGGKVEAFAIEEDGKYDIFLSPQIMAKKKGKKEKIFQRNLKKEEILDQLLFFYLQFKDKKKIKNIFFWGEGEPLYNLENILATFDELKNPYTYGLKENGIIVTTDGVAPLIKVFTESDIKNVRLAIHLNAPTQELRKKIVPVAKIYDLDSLMESAKLFSEKKHSRVIFTYALLPEINDSPSHAYELVKLLRTIFCEVHLLINKKSKKEKLRSFKKILEISEIPVRIREFYL